jgi:hypothetical protein
LTYVSPILSINNIVTNRTGYTISFYNSSSQALLLGQYVISPSVTSDSFNLDLLIVGNGYTVSQIGTILINNNEGYENQFNYSPISQIGISVQIADKLKGFTVFGRLSSYLNLCDNPGSHISKYEIDNPNTCFEFRPRLALDSGLHSYTNSSSVGIDDFSPVDTGQTIDITQYTNSAIVSDSSMLLVGMFVCLNSDTSRYYLIRSMRGNLIFFEQNFDKPLTGTYSFSVAGSSVLKDTINGNNMTQLDTTKISKIE